MAGGNLTPRQKMINMMYLVLTALLALNISKEVLNALVDLEDGLDKTAKTVASKNADVYDQFAAAAQNNPTKVGPWRDKAYQVRDASNSIVEEVEKIKTQLIEETGGYKDESNTVPKGLENLEKAADYLLNQGNGDKLKKSIETHREKLVGFVADNPQLKATILNSLNTDDIQVGDHSVDWVHGKFEHYPLVASLAFLTDIQARVRNAESEVIAELQRNIDKGSLKFTGVRAVVMPKSNYLLQGDQYEADVFLAAYDDTQEPEVVINGTPLPKDQVVGGVGKVKFSASRIGTNKWAGVIRLSTNGEVKEYPIENEYNVAPPMAVISPTKMNVLYRGVENPLEIGVPGVDPAKVVVTGPGVRQVSPGQFIADVTSITGQKEVEISVAVKDETGTKQMGKKVFRLKNVPPAQGSILGVSDGLKSAGFIKQGTIQAKLADFPFEMELNVVSFEIVIPGFPPTKIQGNKLDGNTKTLLDKVKNGSTVVFRGIKATGPKGLRVDASSFSIDVNN